MTTPNVPDVSGLSDNVDATYPDNPADPSAKVHQSDHDLVHDALKVVVPYVGQLPADPAELLRRTEASATYVASAIVQAGAADLGEAISSAIAALPASGGEVVVLRGVHTLTSRFDVPADVTVRFLPGARVTVPVSTVVGVARLTGNRAKITGLEVRGNGAGKTADAFCIEIGTGLADVQVTFCDIREWRGTGIFGKSLIRPQVRFCHGQDITRTTGGGALVQFTYDTVSNADTVAPLVESCSTKNTAGTGIQFDGDWNRLDWRTAGAKVRGGRIIGCRTEGSKFAGIFVNSGFDCVISSCTSQGNDDYGIGYEFSSDSVITGCTAQLNLTLGFALLLKNVGCAIVNSTATGNAQHGLFVDNNGTALPGDSPSSDNLVAGCVARNNGFFGLRIGGGPLRTVTGSNALQGNTQGSYSDEGVGTTRQAPSVAVPGAARMIPDNWYSAGGTARGTQGFGNGLMTAVPLHVVRPGRVVRLAVNITAAGTAGSVVRLGIYGDSNGRPGALVSDAGTIPGTATGVIESALLDVKLDVGTYWITAVPQGAPTTSPTLGSVSGDTGLSEYNNSSSALTGGAGWFVTGITAALPATFSATPSLAGNPYAVAARA